MHLFKHLFSICVSFYRSFNGKTRLLFERVSKLRVAQLQWQPLWLNSKWTNKVKTNLVSKQVHNIFRVLKLIIICIFVISIAVVFSACALWLLNLIINSSILTILSISRLLKSLTDAFLKYWTSNKKPNEVIVDEPITSTTLDQSTYDDKIEKQDSTQDYKKLKLIKHAQIVSTHLQRLNDTKRLASLVKLSQLNQPFNPPLDTTSTQPELSTLIMHYNATQLYIFPQIEFNRQSPVRGNIINPTHNLSTLNRELRTSSNVFEFPTSSENEQTKKILSQPNTSVNDFNLINFANEMKLHRWLDKNTFMHSQDLVNTNLITNTKKLFAVGANANDVLNSNLWATNNLIKNVTDDSTLKNFKNVIVDSFDNASNINSSEVKSQGQVYESMFNSLDNLKAFNDEFIWFKKNVYEVCTNSSTGTSTIIDMANPRNGWSEDEVFLSFLFYKLDKAEASLPIEPDSLMGRYAAMYDITTTGNNSTLFNSTNLKILSELSNINVDSNGNYYHFSLNSYTRSLFIIQDELGEDHLNTSDTDDFDIDDIVTDFDQAREIIRASHPNYHLSIAEVDVIDQLYVRYLHRLINEVIRKINMK